MKKYLLFALLLSGLMTSAQIGTINVNCKAYFKYAVNHMLMTPVAGTAINFYDKSEVPGGTVIAWFWDFGDRTTSREQNPMHLFPLPVPNTNVILNPYRTVSLRIITSDSCKSLYSETINILDGNIYTPPACSAGYKYYQTAYDSITGTAAVQFNNYSSGDSLSYFWQFDNGITSTEKDPLVKFNVRQEAYKVCLTITGKNSCTDSFCDAVSVTSSGPPIINPPIGCQISFGYLINYKIQTLAPALVLDFYSKALPDASEWLWNFDDGTTSTEQNPTHIFNLPLVKDSINGPPNPFRKVCLTVKTLSGCSATYCEMINIYMGTTPPVNPTPCRALFKYYPTAFDTIKGTASYQLTNLSEGDSLSYSWKFGNGTSSTEKEPMVTFDTKTPVENVCLIVTGRNSCTNTYCDTIRIINPGGPIILPPDCETAFGFSVNYDIKTFAPALVLNFYSKATPNVTTWSWDFGDGTTSNEQNPTHIFNFPLIRDSINYYSKGDRKVCLTAKTITGCVANYCQTINIYMNTTPPVEPVPQCHAMFKYYRPTDIASIPEVIPYKLIDASEGKVISRLWQFEDGTTSTEVEPLVNFNFTKPTQKVCLTIHTADSCSSTWCETIFVTEIRPDTNYIAKPAPIYTMRYESGFPIQMSSCQGWANAQVYQNDSLINASNYAWSTGTLGQEVKGLCPTQTYTVKAIAPDGTIVSDTFIFNSDGTVTEIPVNWYVSGKKDNPVINCQPNNINYTVEWRLCDGSVVQSDSIPVNLINLNCAATGADLIMKDASGNVVYTENISLNTVATYLNNVTTMQSVKLFPNPVRDVLTIQYSGTLLNETQIEIIDVTGKSILNQKIYQVEPGQTVSLNVTSLPKGIYICKMVSEKQVIGMMKFIK